MRRNDIHAIAACVAGCLILTACPEVSSGKHAEQCARASDKCTLPSGVLGICDTVECTDGGADPCLVCRSQH
jgi:hypothetical protein